MMPGALRQRDAIPLELELAGWPSQLGELASSSSGAGRKCGWPTLVSRRKPRRTLLVNFWTRSPPGATDAPLPQLSCCPPWVAASAPRAALAPTLTVPTGTDFCADTTSWREQQVPPAIRDELLSVHRRGAPRLVLCAYDASQQGLDGLTGGADWTEELDRRRDVMAV